MGTKQSSTENADGDGLKGPVLEVLKSLLQKGRSDAVVALVEKLVNRNSELEQRLAQLLSRGHKNEGVSSAQLKLFVDALSTESGGEAETLSELANANEKLRDASGIDQRGAGGDETPKGKRQPPLRRPIPPGLRRVDNLIAVPAQQRGCPRCGAERKCIGTTLLRWSSSSRPSWSCASTGARSWHARAVRAS